jgi:hypothetical protein
MSNTYGLAIASLVLGIAGFILMWVPVLGFLLALLALIFGIVSLIKIKKTPQLEGKGMAIAGIVLSGISIIFSLIFLLGALAFFSVLDPNSLMPESCIASSGAACFVGEVNGNNLDVAIKNNLGQNIMLDSSKISSDFGCEVLKICAADNSNCNDKTASIQDGASAVLTLSCPVKKGFNMMDLSVQYTTSESEYANIITVAITKKVE